jgi:hypothetical protein
MMALKFYPLHKYLTGRVWRLITYQRKEISNTYMTVLKFYPLHKRPLQDGFGGLSLTKEKSYSHTYTTGPKLILFPSTHYRTDSEAYHLAKRRHSHTYMTLSLYIYHLNYPS